MDYSCVLNHCLFQQLFHFSIMNSFIGEANNDFGRFSNHISSTVAILVLVFSDDARRFQHLRIFQSRMVLKLSTLVDTPTIQHPEFELTSRWVFSGPQSNLLVKSSLDQFESRSQCNESFRGISHNRDRTPNKQRCRLHTSHTTTYLTDLSVASHPRLPAVLVCHKLPAPHAAANRFCLHFLLKRSRPLFAVKLLFAFPMCASITHSTYYELYNSIM